MRKDLTVCDFCGGDGGGKPFSCIHVPLTKEEVLLRRRMMATEKAAYMEKSGIPRYMMGMFGQLYGAPNPQHQNVVDYDICHDCIRGLLRFRDQQFTMQKEQMAKHHALSEDAAQGRRTVWFDAPEPDDD